MAHPQLKVTRLSSLAYLPKKASSGAAGYDLFSANACVIPPMGSKLCFTDIQISFPDGCYGRIAPRSGLAVKFGIHIGGGVVDCDYRGNIGMLIFNFGCNPFTIEPGHRVAQLILEKYVDAVVVEEKVKESAQVTGVGDRGPNGFGSTGI